jgi:hypothetical protein
MSGFKALGSNKKQTVKRKRSRTLSPIRKRKRTSGAGVQIPASHALPKMYKKVGGASKRLVRGEDDEKFMEKFNKQFEQERFMHEGLEPPSKYRKHSPGPVGSIDSMKKFIDSEVKHEYGTHSTGMILNNLKPAITRRYFENDRQKYQDWWKHKENRDQLVDYVEQKVKQAHAEERRKRDEKKEEVKTKKSKAKSSKRVSKTRK